VRTACHTASENDVRDHSQKKVMLLCSLPPSRPCNMIHMQNTQNLVGVLHHLTKLQRVYFTVHHIRTQKFAVYRDLWPICT